MGITSKVGFPCPGYGRILVIVVLGIKCANARNKRTMTVNTWLVLSFLKANNRPKKWGNENIIIAGSAFFKSQLKSIKPLLKNRRHISVMALENKNIMLLMDSKLLKNI